MSNIKKFRIKSFKNNNNILKLEKLSLKFGKKVILDNLSFEGAFKLSLLTLTNTVTSSLFGLDYLSFSDFSSITKMSLIVFMILGKIEIIAILFLMSKFIFRK